MDIERATTAFEAIRATQHKSLRHDLLRAAVNYAHHRAEWSLAEPEQRREMDQARTAAHNAFIDACNILNRQMTKSGEPTGWRETLVTDRKEIGDFACFVTMFVGLAAR
ncbi:MAG: hypothetical protein ACOYOU_05885 [Kiritimatiellia bacterium]